MRCHRWEETVRRARALAVEATSLAPSGPDGVPDPVGVGWLSSAVGWLAESAPSWTEMAGRTPLERSYRLTGVGADARARLVGPGRAVAFDGRYIHDVRNRAVEAATSVHVYSAASRPMAFYRFDGVRVRTVDLGADRSLVEAEVAAEESGRKAAADAIGAAVTVPG
jgi:hypothetical protein